MLKFAASAAAILVSATVTVNAPQPPISTLASQVRSNRTIEPSFEETRVFGALEPDAAPSSLAPSAEPSATVIPPLADMPPLTDMPEIETPERMFASFERAAALTPLPQKRPPTFEEVCDTLAESASNHALPAPFLIRLLWQESGFRHNVVSQAGAQGVAQFMPETASRYGLDDPFDPLKAVRASAHLLQDLKERFGNFGLAAAAYNAGPKRVLDWLAKRGTLPQETQDYVRNITGKPAEQWRAPATVAEMPRIPRQAPCQREAGLYAANGPERIPLPPSLQDSNVAVATKDIAKDTKKEHAKGDVKLASNDAASPAAVDTVKTSAGAAADMRHGKRDRVMTATIKIPQNPAKADTAAKTTVVISAKGSPHKGSPDRSAKTPIAKMSVATIKTSTAKTSTTKPKAIGQERDQGRNQSREGKKVRVAAR